MVRRQRDSLRQGRNGRRRRLTALAMAVSVLAASGALALAPTSIATAGAATQPMQITTTTLEDAVVGDHYSWTLDATGGNAPYSWSIVSGSLPSGLSLLQYGSFYGVPEQAGTYQFMVAATDSSTPQQQASQALSLTVVPDQPLTITTASLPNATTGAPYSATLQAAGGVPPYAWSVASGTLPAGLSLSSSGTISGSADLPGSTTFVVQATDYGNAGNGAPTQTATQQLSITVSSGNPTLDPTLIAIGSAVESGLGSALDALATAIGTLPGLEGLLGNEIATLQQCLTPLIDSVLLHMPTAPNCSQLSSGAGL